MRRLSPLGLRIFTVSALTIVAVIAVGWSLVQGIATRAVDASLARALDATQAAIQDKLDARVTALRATATVLVAVPTYLAGVERALASGDRGTLLDLADELRRQLGAGWTMLTDHAGVLAAWSDRPDQYGINLANGALIGLALQGATTAGVWLEPGDHGDVVYQAVAVPMRTVLGAPPIGVLVAALPVDSSLAASLKKNTDSEILFFTRDTLGAAVPNVSTLPTMAATEFGLGTDTTAARLTVRHAGDTWVGTVGPLRTANGSPLAGVVGFRSRRAELAPFLALRRGLIWALAGGLVLAVLSSAWLARRITQPVRGLVAMTRQVEQGNYLDIGTVDSPDEIGELSRALSHMVAELAEKQRLVDFLKLGRMIRSSTPTGTRTLASSLPEAFSVGAIVAHRYQLEKLLGAGGMGVVYRAVDRELGETVALKCLHQDLAFDQPEFLERFKQEIRLARRITHRNVVRTHDLGKDAGRYFITMEFVEGTTFDELIARKGSLPVDVTLTVVKQVLRALEVAHEAGVIHRDIKPANLVVDPAGFVKVMDFGIARLAERVQGKPALTEAGSVVGSPDYMAPEQLLGQVVDHRVDLYATGCVMFEALTGRKVFEASNLIVLIGRHLEESAPDIATLLPDLPKEVAAIVMRALAKNPADRWPSAAAMRAAVESA